MALKQTINLIDNFGEEIKFVDAYVKVDSVSGSKEGVNVYVGKYKTNGGLLLAKGMFNFVPSMTGENFIKQAYDYLKTLPEFAGAQDC